MDAENTLDHQIAPEIERLRAQFTDTQELYREVCARRQLLWPAH